MEEEIKADNKQNEIKPCFPNTTKCGSQNSLKVSITLPKSILMVSETIIPLIDRKRNGLYNDFIVDELESYACDLDALILYILKKSELMEQLRVGINQFYNQERYEKKPEDNNEKNNPNEFETIDITFKFPEILIEFLNKFCEISSVSIENFFSFLVMSRLEYIYSDPEMLLNYIDNEHMFFKDLQEGIDLHYQIRKRNEEVLS